jgi:hypothetical protein
MWLRTETLAGTVRDLQVSFNAVNFLTEKHLASEGGLPSMELATTFMQVSITDLIKRSRKF